LPQGVPPLTRAALRIPRAWQWWKAILSGSLQLSSVRPALFFIAAVGGVSTALWVAHASTSDLVSQARAFNWLLALPAVGLTCANLVCRFLRWQFLLRRAGIRLPIRESLRVYIAGLAMLLTPAYAGEGLKVALVGVSGRGSYLRTTGVVVAERLFDAVALALIGGAALIMSGERELGLVLGSAGLAGGAAFYVAPTRLRLVFDGVARLRWLGPASVEALNIGPASVSVALMLSLAAWLAGCLALAVVAFGAGLSISVSQAVATYSSATLLGGMTLLPAGVGVVGTAIVLRLEALGAAPQQAVLTAILVRLLTVWFTVVAGVVGSWLAWRRSSRRGSVEATVQSHFDDLAPAYAAQLSPLARERVVSRKAALMHQYLATHGINSGARLLDAGCGQGWYVRAMAEHGYRVTGLDLAPGQLAAARRELTQGNASTEPLAAASVLQLPFQNGSFDAAFAVNVLHHVGGTASHNAALAEIARVVRPGGFVFVHEINTVNPLFRLYMSYIFPLWRRIDEGTESWLDPRRPPLHRSLVLLRVHCYTFLPDFTPAMLYRVANSLEARLEQSPWRQFSAHFTAVYRRSLGS
jgi:ubiquinone/menaquinone biosynthesis C-methylase UbiE/uncharacterized membrane protein YbhN (UPF0104 family)